MFRPFLGHYERLLITGSCTIEYCGCSYEDCTVQQNTGNTQQFETNKCKHDFTEFVVYGHNVCDWYSKLPPNFKLTFTLFKTVTLIKTIKRRGAVGNSLFTIRKFLV